MIHEECIFDNNDAVKSFSTRGLSYLPYCKDSGRLCDELCEQDIRGSRAAYGYFSKDNIPHTKCEIHEKLDINGYTFSAPNIERTLYDGIYVADEEYNLKNLAVTDGFDDE